MAYNNIVSRSDASALIPEDVSSDMLKKLPDESAVLSRFRRVPVSRNQKRFPVLSALPVAYFVSGDTGLKQTTEQNWANKYLDVEELAAICPIPENVLDDAEEDMWDQIQPRMIEAIGRALDAAVFFGTNKPAAWPTAISGGATAAGNTRTRGTATQAQGGIAEDINQLMGTVETDGFDVNGFVTARPFKSRLRGARATDGQKLLDVSTNELEGQPITYTMRGLWPSGVGAAELFAGDFAEFVVGVRKDFTWKLLTEAVIQDNTGAIQYNLAQQDMVAMRITFRVGWQVSNTINNDQPTEANRYPVGVLVAP